MANRVHDVALEDGETRSPLGGLFPADLPVPSLDVALAPFGTEMPHLDAASGRSVKLARKHAKKVRPYALVFVHGLAFFHQTLRHLKSGPCNAKKGRR